MRKPPIGRTPEGDAAHEMYNSRRWRKLRAAFLQANPLCTMCERDGIATKANVADHIKPHRADRALFFAWSNLQPLCFFHHNGEKKSDEAQGYSARVGPDGYPLDPLHPFNRTGGSEKGF